MSPREAEYSQLGHTLDRLRRKAGIPSFKELARRTNGQISYNYLMELVWGKRKKPALDKMAALAHALNVSIDDLNPASVAGPLADRLPGYMGLLSGGQRAEIQAMKTGARFWWTMNYILDHFPEYPSMAAIAEELNTTEQHLADIRDGDAHLTPALLERLRSWTGLEDRHWILGAREVPTKLLSYVLSSKDARERLEIVAESIEYGVSLQDFRLAWEACKGLVGKNKKSGE